MQHKLLLEILEFHAREPAAGSPRMVANTRDDAAINAGVSIARGHPLLRD
jgi:hypothetical protein